MTQEEILRMAREAGVYGPFMGEDEDLERFAQLVAKAERERLCAQLRQLHDSLSLASDPTTIRARGQLQAQLKTS